MEPNKNNTAALANERLSFNRASLDKILAQPVPETGDVLDFFKQKYAAEYAADSGVWEKYTIEQHTRMVMTQYDKYFSKEDLPLEISPAFFKVILALHDIGKPEAIRSGGKHLQHEFTSKIIVQILPELGFGKRETNIALAMVTNDYIGSIIKGGSIESNAEAIRVLAKEKELPSKELLELMLILYQVDAGSYTEDAGGLPSLDRLFVFDSKNCVMSLSSEPLEKVDKLRQLVA
jgi:CRISPR/Cas system-associated endonuclease Cas3-HD